MKARIAEFAAWMAVLTTLLGLPMALWSWKDSGFGGQYPAGTKVFTLTATADEGIWTLDEIVGHNYWRHSYQRVENIPLKQGDHVVVRLKSVDVLHSFAIPLLRIGPVDVPAGHVKEIEFDVDRSGALTFLCWQVCSPDHGRLKGQFVVEPPETDVSNESSPW